MIEITNDYKWIRNSSTKERNVSLSTFFKNQNPLLLQFLQSLYSKKKSWPNRQYHRFTFFIFIFFSFSFPRYPRGRRQLARGHREKILGCRYDSILVPARVSITDSVKLTDAAAVFRPLKLIGESALPALPDSANVASTSPPSEDASVCWCNFDGSDQPRSPLARGRNRDGKRERERERGIGMDGLLQWKIATDEDLEIYGWEESYLFGTS